MSRAPLMRAVCGQCGVEMDADGFESVKSVPRFSFKLTVAGETALFSWPLLVRRLTAVDLAGQTG